jgi:hypothetical protein
MPSLLPKSSMSHLGDHCIERELKAAAMNAEKNRNIQIDKQNRRETPRIQRLSAALSCPDLTHEKADFKVKKGSFKSATKTMRELSLSFANIESLESTQAVKDNGRRLSLGSSIDLIGDWANTITFSIFKHQKPEHTFALEAREHNGCQLVLM